MIDSEVRLDALVRYAFKKGRPLSLSEYRYLQSRIHRRKCDRVIHGWFSLGVGFGGIILGGLALSVTPFALVLMFGGAFLNLLAAESLDPREAEVRSRKEGK